jgi:hypothetical protein
MKSKIALFLSLVVFTPVMTLAPLQASQAGVAERPSDVSESVDDGGCGNASAYDITDTLVPSLTVTMSCDNCRFDESDLYALLRSYGNAAQHAGYIVDPLSSYLFVITEIGVLPDGRPYLKGVLGDKQITVGDPFPGESLATVAGKLALIAVSHDR